MGRFLSPFWTSLTTIGDPFLKLGNLSIDDFVGLLQFWLAISWMKRLRSREEGLVQGHLHKVICTRINDQTNRKGVN